MAKRKSKKKSNKKVLWAILCIVLALLIGGASLVISIFTSPVMKDNYELYITDKNFKTVVDSLEVSGKVKMWQFKLLSRIFKYNDNTVKNGYYFLSSNATGTSIVRKLRSGAQDEKKLTFNRLVSIEDAAGKLSKDLEIDSTDMIRLLSDNDFLSNYSLDDITVTKETVFACFIPNTYNVFWDISAEELFHRLYFEQNKFWNEQRLAKAKAINMNRMEIITLASIVELETDRNSEKKTIASVYLNRLRRGMLLQADPTVKFAVGDRTIRRILYSHLKHESPYNTYINEGLPPGPICTPTLSSINAVLENYKTPYYYFCASPDFSGAHVFAKTSTEHSENAAAYHAALNARKEEREQKKQKTDI